MCWLNWIRFHERQEALQTPAGLSQADQVGFRYGPLAAVESVGSDMLVGGWP